MAALQYPGRVGSNLPTSGSVMTVSSLDTLANGPEGLPQNGLLVTDAYVQERISGYTKSPTTPGAALMTSAQVTARLAGFPTPAAVSAADATAFKASQLAQPGGVATLDENGVMLGAQISLAGVSDRIMVCYDVQKFGTVNMASSSIRVNQLEPRETLLATVNVPDPGYPWVPMPFATVWGQAIPNTATPDPSTDVGTVGFLSVLDVNDSANEAYGVGAAMGRSVLSPALVLPNAANTAASADSTSSKTDPVIGPMSLGLYASRWLGTDSYQFVSQALRYWVIAAPAM